MIIFSWEKEFHDGKEMHTHQSKGMFCREKGFLGISGYDCIWHNTLVAADTFSNHHLVSILSYKFPENKQQLTDC
jgi:hypothetical protein